MTSLSSTLNSLPGNFEFRRLCLYSALGHGVVALAVWTAGLLHWTQPIATAPVFVDLVTAAALAPAAPAVAPAPPREKPVVIPARPKPKPKAEPAPKPKPVPKIDARGCAGSPITFTADPSPARSIRGVKKTAA